MKFNSTLLFLILILAIFPVAALDIQPTETNLCEKTVYTVLWSDERTPISLIVEIPDGFTYNDSAAINYSGTVYSQEPVQNGNILTWNFVNHVVINEVDLSNNKVELFNPTQENINLNGWSIETSQGNFPLNGTINAGGYAVFNVSMNNSEQVKLYKNGNLVDQTPLLNYQSGKTWQRYPNGKDTDIDDWESKSPTLGSSNGGTNDVEVSFILGTCCNTESGKRINATVYYYNDKDEVSRSILVNKPFIVLDVEPDTISAHLKDVVTYQIKIENTGSAPVHNVSVNVYLNNLTLVNITTGSLSWIYDVINPSETKVESINVSVASCKNQYLNVTASWGCCKEICQFLYSKGSIRFLPRYPALEINVNDVTFGYCEKSRVNIILKNNGDGDIYDLKLKMLGLPVDYVSNENTTFFKSNATFFVGNLSSNSQKVVSFDLGMNSGSCSIPPSGTVVIKPYYYDECHRLWKPPITFFKYSYSGGKPIVSISKSANVSTAYVGDSVRFNITASYSNGTCNASVDAIIEDQYSEHFDVVDSGGGTVDEQNHTIVWNVKLSNGQTWNKSIVLKIKDDPCICGRTLTNEITLNAGNDCCGCPLEAQSSASVIVECYNNTVESSSKTATPRLQEVCKDITYLTNYTFSKELNWSDIQFMEAGNNNQTFPDGSYTGTAYFIVNGTTNVSHSITLGEWVNLGFLGDKVEPGTTLQVKYTLRQNNPGSFADWSYLNVTGYGYQCNGGGGFYKEAVLVDAVSPSLAVSVDIPDILNACEDYNATIYVTKTTNFKVYNVTVYFDDSHLKYIGPCEISGIQNESGSVNSFEPIRNGNVLIWHLGNLTSGGTIKFKFRKDCSPTAKAEVWADYQTYCDLDCQNCIRHSSGSDESLLFTTGDIVIQKTPDVVYATQRTISWNIYVINKGNGTAKNVTVVDLLGSDFKYESSSIDGTPASPNVNGNVITWNLGDLRPKEKKTIKLNATFVGCLNTDNLVYARWGCCADSCFECQNVSDTSIVETPEGELTIVRHDGDLVDECGGNANFSIVVKNVGATYVYDAKVIEELPDCLDFVSQSANPSADDFKYFSSNNTLIWYYNEIPMESTININFTAKINNDCVCQTDLGDAIARVNFTSPCGRYGTEDVKPFSVKKGLPHLSIDKIPSRVLYNNSNFNWTIRIKNDGDYKARNITLVDILPSNVGVVSANPSPDSNNSNELSWNIPDLDVDEVYEVNLTLNVTACGDNTENQATVYWGCCLPQKNSSVTATLVTKPDLRVYRNYDVNTCGGNVTITITNNGAIANNATLADYLPDQYAYAGWAEITSNKRSLSVTPTVSGNQLKWDIGIIYPNEKIVVEFGVKNAGCERDVCNIADKFNNVVFLNYSDCSNKYSIQKTDSANVKIIRLDVKKEPEKQVVIPGQKAEWEIKVSSNYYAPNVTVEDVLGSAFYNVEVYYDNGSEDNTATITDSKITWTGQTIKRNEPWVRWIKADVNATGSLENNVTAKGYCPCGCLYSLAGDLFVQSSWRFVCTV